MQLRQKHPHLKCVVIEDGLSSNEPNINDLIHHDLRFILSAKRKDYVYLFEQLDTALTNGEVMEFS